MTREEAIKVIEEAIKLNPSLEKKQHPAIESMKVSLTALRGPTREMVERMRGYWMHKKIQSSNSVTGYFKLPKCECSNCGCIVLQETNFCPHCGEPKTGKAMDMMLERWTRCLINDN